VEEETQLEADEGELLVLRRFYTPKTLLMTRPKET